MKKINIKNLLRLGLHNEVRPIHLVLGNRQQDKLGEINNVFSINYHPQLQTSELSFTVYKTVNGEECHLWDEIIPRRLLWVKEYDEWFEIYVDIDDSEKVVKKNITATALCQAELSNINIDGAEINTEADIARDDYISSTFYNPDNKKASILDRLLEKVPNYTIKHVDETLWKLWRAFSVSEGTNIYDYLTGTVQEEIGCLFIFDSNERGVYVYDMQTTCLDCGHRDEGEWLVCPKCGNKILHMPYGQDTTILVSKENLGQDIQLTSNANEVKNCFRITGGDEYINAAIINANPNGTNVIYEFDDDTRKDMPDELVEKIDNYDKLVEEYNTTHIFELDSDIVSQINEVIAKINAIYPDKFEPIASSYTGYSHITEKRYDMYDLSQYLNSAMMPTWEQADTTAQDQVELIQNELSVVSVKDVSVISESTADNAVLLMVRAIIDTNIYKPELIDTSLSSQTWTGKVKLTNYSDEEDNVTSEVLTVEINDDMENFLNQSVQKITAKIDTLGVKELFDIDDLDEFRVELQKYCLASLKSFENAYNTVLLALTDVKASETDSEFYESFYTPYYEKLGAIQEEISVRDTDMGIVIVMQEELLDIMSDVKDKLNFEKYLGEDLWNTFISYRREDSYSNENYISDGLSNAELVAKANELIEVAHKELIKSSSKQYTISGTLTNLLLITDEDGKQVFAPILEDFTFGNFIRCKIDGIVYRMRILDVTIDYDNIGILSITFGDITKGSKTLPEKMSDVIKQSNSVAASYSAVKKQAKQGENAGNTLDKLRQEGLNSAQYNVFNTNSTFIMDNHGLLGRNYDDVTNQFTPEQFRINGCNLIMTDDNWASTRLAIGKQIYTLNGLTQETYGVNADTVISGIMIAGDIYSANYRTDNNGNIVEGTHLALENGDFDLADGRLSYRKEANILNLKGVTLDWNSSTTPSISDIDGLGDRLDGLDSLTQQALDQAQQGIQDAANAVDLAQQYANTAESNATNYADEKDSETLIEAKGYTDTTTNTLSTNLTSAYQNYTDSKVSALDTAVGKYLGLGGSTLIGTNYVISPYIGGGYLNIVGTDGSKVIADPNNLTNNNYIFQVHNGKEISVGITKDGTATFNGEVNATSGVFSGTVKGGDININNKFIVDKDGNVTLPSGTSISWNDVTGTDNIASKDDIPTNEDITKITEDTISTTNILAQNLQVNSAHIKGQLTADQINTQGLIAENISSTTIEGKTINGGSISIGDNFNVDEDGNMTCKNANVEGTISASTIEGSEIKTDNFTVTTDGEINAKSGKIGGWTINDTKIFGGDATTRVAAMQFPRASGMAWVFAAGGTSHDSYADCPFRVHVDGTLYATKAEITGAIKSGSTISGSTITGSKITCGSNFTATSDGTITAKAGTIGGWNISGTGLSYSASDAEEGWSFNTHISTDSTSGISYRYTSNLSGASVQFSVNKNGIYVNNTPLRQYILDVIASAASEEEL